MDLKKLNEAHDRFDKEFNRNHMDFVLWWAKHRHKDSDPKYAISPRIAFKCLCYEQEFLEAKEIGIA